MSSDGPHHENNEYGDSSDITGEKAWSLISGEGPFDADVFTMAFSKERRRLRRGFNRDRKFKISGDRVDEMKAGRNFPQESREEATTCRISFLLTHKMAQSIICVTGTWRCAILLHGGGLGSVYSA
jgi:hypothetical protein